jgi:uncharacterized sulfatase
MPAQPNIIVFFTDQQRWDTCGCYGQALPTTPNLDAMAREGTQFRYAFTNQPVCGPTRAVMQTGRYATETGCFTNAIALRTDEDTVAKRLRAAGYEAGYIGKWHLASTLENRLAVTEGRVAIDQTVTAVRPEYRGGFLDYWLAADTLEHTSTSEGGYMFDGDGCRVDFGGYRVDTQTDFAIDYLRTRTRERPFFLFLSYLEPHHQNDANRYEGPPGSKERWADYTVPGDLEGTGGDWRENYPDYLGCVNALDAGLGRVRAELAHLGIADNTVVLFTSDHGSHFRTRNREYKRSCHESSLRIPLVAAGPGFTGGGVRDEMACLIDVAPTVLTAAGLPVPDDLPGRALQDAAAGRVAGWRTTVFAQISEHEMGRTVRTDRWKYAVNVPGDTGWERPTAAVYHEAYLYDLQVDPHERTNLVADPAHAAVRAELRAELLRYIRDVEGYTPELRESAVAHSRAIGGY